jgi:arylamine N-acetyltransferase
MFHISLVIQFCQFVRKMTDQRREEKYEAAHSGSRHSRIWQYLHDFEGIRWQSQDHPSVGFNQRMHCVCAKAKGYRVMF